MKLLRNLLVPRRLPDDDEEKESVRKAQAQIRARLAALDARVSVQTRKTYTGGVVNANLKQSHRL